MLMALCPPPSGALLRVVNVDVAGSSEVLQGSDTTTREARERTAAIGLPLS